MARIPDVTDLGARPVTGARAVRTRDASGEILGAAIGAAARTVQSVAGDFIEREDRFNYAQARSQWLQADLKARQALEQDNNYATYGQRYQDAMTKAGEIAVQGIRGRRDRLAFQQEAQLDLARGAATISQMARQKNVDAGRASLAQTMEANRTAALDSKDENSRAAFVTNTLDAISGAQQHDLISAQEATAHRQKWTADYAEGYLDIQSLPDRIKTLSSPKGTPADYIAPDRRTVLLKAAQNELKAEQGRVQAEARQMLGDQMQDIAAAAQAGVPVKQVPSKAALQLAFGEREGAQRYDSARKLANMSVEIASLHGLPAEDLIAQAEKYRPTQAEGAAEQSQLYGIVGRAVSGILNERQKDPAGYLLQHSEPVQQAWAAFQGNPELAPAYLSAVRAEKGRMGIDGPDILPNAYAQGIADELNTAQTAEQLASRVESEVQRWGDAWPTVQGQLSDKVSDLTLIMGSGIPRSASVTLASTMKLKDSELKAMLPVSTKWSDVEGAVDDKFADFQRSLPPEAARTWNAVRDSALRLSVKYMNDGNSSKDAVSRAYQDLVESQYTLKEFRGTTLRIPASADAEAIEFGARLALEDITPDFSSVIVPRGIALSAEEYASEWTKHIRENGYFATSPDGKGVWLYADGGPVYQHKDGKPDFSWDQLQDSGAARRASDRAAFEEQLRKERLKRQQMR